MKIVFFLFMFILTNSFLHAVENYDGYKKKIILQRSSKKFIIDKEYSYLKNTKMYVKLNKLGKENGFIIHVRPLGKNTILVAEPIFNENVFKKAMALIKTKYKHARGVKDKLLKSEIVKKEVIKKELELKKPIPIVHKQVEELQEEVVEKVEEVVPQVENSILDVVEQKIIEPVDENIEETGWFSIWYIILIIFFAVFAIYFVKFKRIYDEY